MHKHTAANGSGGVPSPSIPPPRKSSCSEVASEAILGHKYCCNLLFSLTTIYRTVLMLVGGSLSVQVTVADTDND